MPELSDLHLPELRIRKRMRRMRDGFGRNINYMRISVTDCCNLRCQYCMPQDMETTEMEKFLTFEELQTVVRAGVKLGITHYRLTGGEPLVRSGCAELVCRIKAIEGVESVSMTTNGVLLAKYARRLKEAGLDSVNVSLDTIDKKVFQRLTGKDALEAVKAGIDAATGNQIPVKINTVNQKETDVEALLGYAEEKRLPIRFIEMMPIGYGSSYEGNSNQKLLKEIEKKYGMAECIREKLRGNGPAVYYRFPGLKQPVGFISAVNQKFCAGCNRIRLSAEGYLKLCLCYDTGVDLREILRGKYETEKLEKVIEQAICKKPEAHCFERAEGITEENVMVKIGG